MKRNSFETLPMHGLGPVENQPAADWLWDGYLGRGNLTLLTSAWKAGKTTLVTGLLQAFGPGGEFLGRRCRPARALVISEESREHWAARLALMPVGEHSRLMSRPFLLRPSINQWHELMGEVAKLSRGKKLDLVVIDPLATFLPGRSDSDAGTLLDFLQPLQLLTRFGLAVLVLHHPRKKSSEEGNSARGSGALLGYVDIILELNRMGHLSTDERRRRLVGLSRHADTPRRLVYQFDPSAGTFAVVGDPHATRFRENWELLRTLLDRRQTAVTHHELLADWPGDRARPAASVFYEWLNLAHAEKLVRREGGGNRHDPYRYWLPNEDDEYRDRGELPPLRDLDEE